MRVPSTDHSLHSHSTDVRAPFSLSLSSAYIALRLLQLTFVPSSSHKWDLGPRNYTVHFGHNNFTFLVLGCLFVCLFLIHRVIIPCISENPSQWKSGGSMFCCDNISSTPPLIAFSDGVDIRKSTISNFLPHLCSQWSGPQTKQNT